MSMVGIDLDTLTDAERRELANALLRPRGAQRRRTRARFCSTR
jgi:hypothetical protein